MVSPNRGVAATTNAAASALDQRVLVLNRLYMAVRIVNARRAFRLLAKDLAEVIAVENGRYFNYDFASWIEFGLLQDTLELSDTEDDWVQTVRFAIPMPRIVRLLTYDRLPQRQIRLNRRNVMARDNHTCQYCGANGGPAQLTLDHVVPRSKGGGDSWRNLVTACKKCNSKKGDRTPDEANMPLSRKPAKPKYNPVVTARISSDRHDCWSTFLESASWPIEMR